MVSDAFCWKGLPTFCVNHLPLMTRAHSTVGDVHRAPQWFNTAHYKSLVMITKK